MVFGADHVVDAQLLLGLNSECKHLILLGSAEQGSDDISVQRLALVSGNPFVTICTARADGASVQVARTPRS